MTILAMQKGDRVPKAKAVCDECGREEVITCDYERIGQDWHPDQGQAITKMRGKGWAVIKGRLFCPKCEARRKAHQPKPEITMQDKPNVVEIRQPSREQKRQIVDMLTAVYDIKAERYRGTETDVTVAEAIGGGCMFGWVAEIREEMFGPDGGNEEYEKLTADIAQWRDNADKLAADMHGTLREFNDARTKVKELAERLDRLIKAAGPKARSIG